MAEIVANGIRTHIQRLGPDGANGTAVVFVHGILIDNMASLYFTVANPVARLARTLLYDLRGHGKSHRPSEGYSLDDLLDDLEAVLDTEGLDQPVYLVGHSYGGLLSMAFAVRHPDRVAGLALIDPPLPLGNWGDRIASLFTFEGEERDEKFKEAWESMHGGAMTRKLRRMQQVATALVEDTRLMADMRGSRALTEADLSAIQCPVLALYGDGSEIIDCADRMAELIPHADLRRFAGCSHRVLFEDTDGVKNAIVGWLEDQFKERTAAEGAG